MEKDKIIYRVPYGRVWKIIGGEVNHITGTDTHLSVLDDQGFSWCDLIKIAGATGSGAFNINDKVATNFVIQVDTKDFWITNSFRLQCGGGTGVNTNLFIHEMMEDEL